ncbi:MAG: DUF1775 domain-containing protein [Vicinamibacterales bacterium]
MRSLKVLATGLMLMPGLAYAHVSVQPRASKPAAEEKYTVRVPTEGQVSTASVFLEVPDGVTVTEVPPPEGATYEVKRNGSRIVAITWTKEIKPKESAQFLFSATNPAGEGQITWKVQQRFADGKSSNWTPATKLSNESSATASVSPSASQATPSSGESAGSNAGSLPTTRHSMPRISTGSRRFTTRRSPFAKEEASTAAGLMIGTITSVLN